MVLENNINCFSKGKTYNFTVSFHVNLLNVMAYKKLITYMGKYGMIISRNMGKSSVIKSICNELENLRNNQAKM